MKYKNLKMMIKYDCPDCGGCGKVANELYAELTPLLDEWREANPRPSLYASPVSFENPMEHERRENEFICAFFREKGCSEVHCINDLPSEEFFCVECNGLGYIKRDIDFSEVVGLIVDQIAENVYSDMEVETDEEETE